MIAKLKKINKKRPDLDTGNQYNRFFSCPSNVKKYLHYKDKAGNQLIDDALATANQKYNFAKESNIECFI